MATVTGYRCIRCGALYARETRFDARGCIKCHDVAPANLSPNYTADRDEFLGQRTDAANSLWRYAPYLPQLGKPVISLDEGLTPLVDARSLGNTIDLPFLSIKDEGRNPTWSHKDRFSTVAVTAARAGRAKVVATASSGNAGASLAAYAAKAGLQCVVTTFAGAAGAMLAQIRAYGATVVPMSRKSDRWRFLEKAAEQHGWFVTSPYRDPVIGSHPLGIEGYKTIAYEIFDQTNGDLPDWCILPVCYGDALAGVYRGFCDLRDRGKISNLPRLVAAEVHGSLSASIESGKDLVAEQVAAFDSIALSIGTTRSTYQALDALRQTMGCAITVTNDELLHMQCQLAGTEGIFAELASAAPLVAAQKLRKSEVIKRDDRVVAIVTASGMKDVQVSTRHHEYQVPFENANAAWHWVSAAIKTNPASS